MIGSIYGEIAESELKVGRFGMLKRYSLSDENIESILSRDDFDYVESIVAAQFSIEVAIEALETRLAQIGVLLPEKFYDILVYDKSPEDNPEVKECISVLESAEIGANFKAITALHMLTKVHAQQAMSSVRELRDIGEYYHLLPIALAGFDSTMSSYYVVEPILDLLGLRPEHHEIRGVYKELQCQFLAINNIHRKKQLRNFLVNIADFDGATADLRVLVRKDGVVDAMLDQILEQSPRLFKRR